MFRTLFQFVALMGAFALAAVAAFYGEVFTTLRDIMLDGSVALGFNVGAASKLSGFLALVLTPFFASVLISIFLGQFFTQKVLLAATTIAVSVSTYFTVTHDWLFDARGSPLVFLCPPEPGQLPRLQRTKADTTLGGECMPVSKDNALAVSALRRGAEPKHFQLDTPSQLATLPTHRFGFPVLWIGPKSGVLYDLAGWDPIGGDLLRPVQPSDMPALQGQLVEKQKTANAEALAKALSEHAKAKELAAQAAEKAKSELEEAQKLARMKAEEDRSHQLAIAENVKRAEMELQAEQLAQAKRERAERERVQLQQALQEQMAYQNSAKRFFHHTNYDGAPLVVLIGDLSYQEKQAVMGHLSGNRFYAADTTVTGDFYNVVRPLQVFNGDYSGLDKLVVANGIHRIIFAQLIARECDCNGQISLRFRIAEFDTTKRLVAHHQRELTV